MKTISHIVRYMPRDGVQDPSYIGNLYFTDKITHAAIVWVADIQDAYMFKTQEQLDHNNWRFGMHDGLSGNPITLIFFSPPDIDALVMI